MRCHTRFEGREETVYMNLHFPAKAVFPDADEVWDVGLVPNASGLDVADLKGRVDFMDPIEQLILREENRDQDID